MLAIARYALKGPMHAATVAGILAILSLFVPLLSILSGAIVSLIILTQGLVSGSRVILVSIVGITAISYLLTHSPMLGITIGVVQWLPLVILAEILRRTRSMSFTLVIGMALALISVVVQFVLWPDAESALFEFLQLMFQDLQQQPGVDMQQLDAGLKGVVHWMTIVFIAVMFATFVGTLLAGRWFQARLAESHGFREEFQSIRIGKGAAVIALILMVSSLALQSNWLIATMMVMLVTFMFQGLAVAHAWARHSGKSMTLVLLYVLMVIFPQVTGVTALLGLIDNWIDFRAKYKSIPTNTDD